MAAKTIKLSREYRGHGLPVSTVTLREPTGWMIIELGDPVDFVAAPGGGYMPVENKEAIRGYLSGLLNVGDDIIGQLVFADIFAIKVALFDFFKAGEGSTTSSEPSGSGSTEDSATSAT